MSGLFIMLENDRLIGIQKNEVAAEIHECG